MTKKRINKFKDNGINWTVETYEGHEVIPEKQPEKVVLTSFTADIFKDFRLNKNSEESVECFKCGTINNLETLQDFNFCTNCLTHL